MEQVIDELVAHLLEALFALQTWTTRYLVGISGAPGSGKTTIAATVVTKLNELNNVKNQAGGAVAVMLPMDGFHFYRSQLDEFPDPIEAHARRGAPHTFDAEKFVELVKSLKSNTTVAIHAPSFDHGGKDPIEDDIPIFPSHRIVVLEGNYVHLTVPPWDQATKLLDERWFITVEREVARERVIQRHMISGIAATEDEARKRFDQNDWPNGEYLLQNSDVETADKIIHSVQDQHMNRNA